MRKWSAHILAVAAVMQWGAVQAQNSADDALIPPSPDQSQNQSSQNQANSDESAVEQSEPIPESPELFPEPGFDSEVDESQKENTPPEESRPLIGESNPESLPPTDIIPNEGSFEISPRVRDATANLDIDDATRARYRWQNGEWWFQTQSGTWMYHREGQWHDFDPTTYQPPRDGRSEGPPFPNAGWSATLSGNSAVAMPLPTRSANSYYYDAPSYQPVPSRGFVYGPRDGYGGRYYDGPRRVGPYRPGYYDGYRDDYGYGGGYGNYYGSGYNSGFYNPRNDRYYGRGPYGRGYSIDGDRYRGGVIGSEIGGRIGGRSGAIIGGTIGAEAADD